IDLAQGIEVLVLGRRLRVVCQKGVDHDHLATWSGDLHRGLAEPLHLELAALVLRGAWRPTTGMQQRCGCEGHHITQYRFHAFLLDDHHEGTNNHEDHEEGWRSGSADACPAQSSCNPPG